MDAIAAQAAEHALDPNAAAMDVFTTAICWVGSKSLSHVLACIDRSKTRLLDASTASPSARAQIQSSVMAYWHAHPGIAVSILEKLLNYSILTPLSVVDWVLGGTVSPNGLESGHALAEPHLLELVSHTVTKVSFRVRQLLSSTSIAEGESVADVEATRDTEIAQMKELFAAINDALGSWASGSKDQTTVDEENAEFVRQWGQRWLRVFTRHAAIEEAFVLEARGKIALDQDTSMEAANGGSS